MAKRNKPQKRAENSLDTSSEKRGRGRPVKIRATEVVGRADNFRGILDRVWDRLWPLLSKAKSDTEIIDAFERGANPYHQNFVPGLATLTQQILQEQRFPNRRKSQINFLADSLAGVGVVTPRRSRDICAEQREKAAQTHHIIRCEFYIECSCGRKGRSINHACPKCGAKIQFPVHLGSVFI